MRLNRKTGVLIAAVSVLASMLVGNAANAAGPSAAVDATSGGIIVSGPGDNVVQFPDGTYVRFDDGRVTVELTADKALYYQCSTGTYCSYYTYQVVA